MPTSYTEIKSKDDPEFAELHSTIKDLFLFFGEMPGLNPRIAVSDSKITFSLHPSCRFADEEAATQFGIRLNQLLTDEQGHEPYTTLKHKRQTDPFTLRMDLTSDPNYREMPDHNFKFTFHGLQRLRDISSRMRDNREKIYGLLHDNGVTAPFSGFSLQVSPTR